MGFDAAGEIGQQLLQAQPDLFRRRAHIGEDNYRLARPNQLGQLRVKADAGVARGRIGFVANWREDFDDRFLFPLRFGDPAGAIVSGEKSGQQLERRGGRGKSNAAE